MRLDRRHAAILLATLLGAAAPLNPRMNSTLAKAPMAAPYAMTRRGPLTMAPCLLGLFAHSSAGVDRADLGWNVLAFSRAAFDAPFDDHPGLTMIFYDLRPGSRGRLRLRSADARQAPRILMNYLATARDRQVAAGGLRLTRRIMAAAALAGQQPVELSPGPAVRDDDEATPQGAIAQRAGTIFHPVGTARRCRRGGGCAPAGAWPGRAVRGRCVGDAQHHLGQHRQPDHHECREGRGNSASTVSPGRFKVSSTGGSFIVTAIHLLVQAVACSQMCINSPS